MQKPKWRKAIKFQSLNVEYVGDLKEEYIFLDRNIQANLYISRSFSQKLIFFARQIESKVHLEE